MTLTDERTRAEREAAPVQLMPYERLETVHTWMLLDGDQLWDGHLVTYVRRRGGRVELELDAGERVVYASDALADIVRPLAAMPRLGVLAVPLELPATTDLPTYVYAGLGRRVHFTDRASSVAAPLPICASRHMRTVWHPSETPTVNGRQADICVLCLQIEEDQ